MSVPKRMIFRKSSKGEGVIFNPKIYVAVFGNYKQGFLSVKLIQKSDFRVVLRKIKTRHTLVVKTV